MCTRVDKRLAITIADKVWNEMGSRDFRDLVKVSRLSNNDKAVSFTVKMMLAYLKRR